jgi:isopentenyl-diphosphate Delta-isomerase
MSERVILVDRNDRPLGSAEKLRAHEEGWLHRAVSVLIVNTRGEMLLQRRHAQKYHSGGLWSNAACSHPRPGEATADAAQRRLEEEMGIRCDLAPAFPLLYRARLDGGLIEHEYDHVFTGRYDGTPSPEASEVTGWRWVPEAALREDVRRRPSRYTYWFRLILERLGKTEPVRPDA